MKNKKFFALIAGFLSCLIFLGLLIGSCTKNSNEKPSGEESEPQDLVVDPSGQQEDQSGQEDQGDQPGEKEPEKDSEKAPEKEQEDKPEEAPEEKPEEKPADKDEEKPEEKPAETTEKSLDYSTKEGIEAILNDPYMLLVNRDHRVSKDFVPSSLVSFKGGYQLNKTCSDALGKLVDAGKKAGYNYILYSGYRTYSSQYNKYYNKIAYWKDQGYSEEKAIELTDEYYAPPGASEHHTGLAADVCISSIVNKYACLHENYDQTAEFKWFSAHAHEYGFILRYPKGKESITGYNYEPWHYRYVGVEIATDIYNRGVTMEEYVADLEAKLKTFE